MRTKRAFLLALCVVAMAGACSSDNAGPGDTGEGNSGGEGPALPITDLPTMCEGFGDVPESGQITFVKGTLVFGVSPDGDGLHCIAGVAGTNPIAWGPQGDFFIDIGFAASEIISAEGRVTVSGPGDSPRFQGISRPEGTSALALSRNGTSLAKIPTTGGKARDISFLRRHDEATYHPVGTQIAVLGESEEGIYGLWLAANDGTAPQLIVPSGDEDEYYGLAYSALGATLYYVDDQHDSFELRVIDLATPKRGIGLPDSTLVVKKKEPISLVVSPFTEAVLAYRVGTCDTGFTTFVREGSATTKIGSDLGETQPFGWLPDDRLLLASTDDLCDPTRTLDIHVVDGERTTLLVENVTQTAVRAVLPTRSEVVSGPQARSAE